MKIALCGFLGSGCTEIAEILAANFGLETLNTSRIITSIENLESLSRSGEIFLTRSSSKSLMRFLRGKIT